MTRSRIQSSRQTQSTIVGKKPEIRVDAFSYTTDI